MLLRRFVLALAGALLPLAASGGVLIEGTADGERLRVVVDRQQGRVLLEQGAERSLVDLAAGTVYLSLGTGTPQRVHARFRPGHDHLPPYRLEKFGPGPVIAGHASTYHVLFDDERVCAEVLTSDWMTPFVDLAVRALVVLDQLKSGEDPGEDEDGAGADACGRVPVTTLAAEGWPLLAGKRDRPMFSTETIRFDYVPASGELALPKRFEALESLKAQPAPAG